jgi:hypothetical protein
MKYAKLLGPISKRAFKKWLQEHSTLKFQIYNACNCPLAQFLSDTRQENYFVGNRTFYPKQMGAFNIQPLPKWARDFVEKIDSSITPTFGTRRCLNVLEKL